MRPIARPTDNVAEGHAWRLATDLDESDTQTGPVTVISWDAVAAFVGSLLVLWLPGSRRIQGFKIGVFLGAIAWLVYDAMGRGSAKTEPGLVPLMAPKAAPAPSPAEPLPPVAEEDRLKASDILTDFAVLRHLRRTGAVSTNEFEAKKADILRRV